MPQKDLHSKPFDDATIAKLEIFEQYTTAWLPVWIMKSNLGLCVFDFFAGTGYDQNKVPGSAIRILQTIGKFSELIQNRRKRVRVYLNEKDQKKYDQLVDYCEEYLSNNEGLRQAVNIHYSHDDFDIVYQRLYRYISDYPSLVFLDQNGIKFLSLKYLLSLERTDQTDFLCFSASTYLLRFGNTDEFKKHLKIEVDKLKNNRSELVHRQVVIQLREMMPQDSELRLYPFTLKKGKNIYGIIFGAKHPVAVEKFLRIAWNMNPINGDANFDIDREEEIPPEDMFGYKKLKKIEEFYYRLTKYLRESKVTYNRDIYNFTLELGHPPNHAADKIRDLKKQGRLNFEGRSPKIVFKSPYKSADLVEIIWRK